VCVQLKSLASIVMLIQPMWPARPFYCHGVHPSVVAVGDFHGGQQLAMSLTIGPSPDVLDASRALGPHVIRLRHNISENG
jgi:hypothetical protein